MARRGARRAGHGAAGVSAVAIPSPRRTYGLVIAVVIVMLVGGLLVPLLFGDPEQALFADGATDGDLVPTGPLGRGDGDEGGGSSTTSTTAALGAGVATTLPGQSTGASVTVPGQAAPTVPGGSGPLTASDVGVTPTTIRIGVVVFDLESVGPLGLALDNYEVETQQRIATAYFDDINRRGGIHGRQVEPVFFTNDPLDATDPAKARAQCLRMTQDQQVFAVVGFITTAAPCVAVEQRTPVMAMAGDLEETYQASRNYFISVQPALERVAREWADALVALGVLNGKTVGIHTGEGAIERRPADALQTRLEGHGITIAYRSNIAVDADRAVAQIPLEVQRMRDAGVDAVLLPTNFAVALTFVQAAESQGWQPSYFTSDIGGLAGDGNVRNASRSFNGTIGVTYSSGGRDADGALVPEAPQDEACRTLYNGTTDGKDFAAGEESPILPFCVITRILEAGLLGAGPNLTRDALVTAVQGLGDIALPRFLGGAFGSGRTDYASTVRPVRWGSECRCYTNAGGPIPPSG